MSLLVYPLLHNVFLLFSFKIISHESMIKIMEAVAGVRLQNCFLNVCLNDKVLKFDHQLQC